MDNQEKILSLVRQRGPLLPSQINKELGVNVLFASAMLGEICDKHLLRLTKLKVGGSPLYYVPGQEAKLTGFADKLGEKDHRAYNLLKQEGVLLDSEQDALFRIALRNIPDFAVPLDVNAGGESHIFWKWYLLPNQDAEKKIMDKLGVAAEEKKTDEKTVNECHVPQPEKNLVLKEQTITVDAAGATHIETEKGTDENTGAPCSASKKNLIQNPPPRRRQKPRLTKATAEEYVQHDEKDAGKEKAKEMRTHAHDAIADAIGNEFYQRVLAYFEKNSIKVESMDIMRMGADIECLIHLPTNVGLIPYFCKAKNKKRCDDDDLAKAYLSGQKRRLPILFLYTGELTKKAKEAVTSEYRTITLREV